MGCSTSKGVCHHHHHHHDFDHVDDSIHALLRHDLKYAKAHGIEPHGYRPRDPHPLLDGPSSSSSAAASHQQQQQSRTAYTDVTVTDTDSTHELITQQQQQHEQRQESSSYHSTGSSSTKEETDEEMNRVLNQYKHHCDTIDPRDVSSLDRNPLLSIIHHHPVITAVEED